MALQITIDGRDITANVEFRTVRAQDTVEIKGDTLNLTVFVREYEFPRPEAGNEIIFLDGATREFAGVVLRVRGIMHRGGRLMRYELSCIDYVYYLDRRYLNKVYTSQRADQMFNEVIDDLKAAANNLDTHYNDFDSDMTLIKVGPTLRQQVFERMLPSQAFEQIAEASGMFWWIDFNKKINLIEIQDNEPSFLPTFLGRKTLLVAGNTTDYGNLILEESIEGTGTKAILSNTTIKSVNTITDTYTWTTGDDYKFFFSRRPFSELDIVSVVRRRGGTPTTLTQILEDVQVDADVEPPTNNAAIFVGPNNQSYARVRSTDMQNGDLIELTYNYAFSDDHENADPFRFIEMQQRTNGDGVHEFLFSKAEGLAVVSPVDLDEISEILLDRKSKIHVTGSFTSFTKGWQAGQVFDILHPYMNIHETFYVIAVTKTVRTPADDPNLGDNIIVSNIEISNVPRGVQL